MTLNALECINNVGFANFSNESKSQRKFIDFENKNDCSRVGRWLMATQIIGGSLIPSQVHVPST